jgi:hypothetical protein
MSYRLNSAAKERLVTFCNLTGMKPSEVVKAAISQFIAATLQNTDCSPQRLQLPDSRAHENLKVIVSKDTSDVVTGENEKKEFFQVFIGAINRKLFPERVSRAVKDQWVALEAWGKGPVEAARLYNIYLKNEQSAGRETCHPNAWLAGHGFLNEEKNDDNEPKYDVDG